MLHPRLERVAGLLLPAAPAARPHVRDRAIARARPRPTPRPPRGLGRWHGDSRGTHPRRFVARDRIVGCVSGHLCDRIVDRLHEVDAKGRVSPRRLSQRVRDDHAVSIAQSENCFGAPGRPDGDGRHASVAAAERHSVTSPRWTKACSYADQCSTRYFVVYCGWTFDRMSRSCTRSGHRGQRAYSGLVAAEGLCTNALSVLAYNLGSLWRRLVLPPRIKRWSLTSLQQRLVKTGGRLVKRARYYWLLLAQGHLTRRLFVALLRKSKLAPSAPTRRFVTDRSRTTLVDQARSFD